MEGRVLKSTRPPCIGKNKVTETQIKNDVWFALVDSVGTRICVCSLHRGQIAVAPTGVCSILAQKASEEEEEEGDHQACIRPA